MPSYERLITEWNLDGDQATRAITWVIGLLVDEAIRHDGRQAQKPNTGTPARRLRPLPYAQPPESIGSATGRSLPMPRPGPSR